MPIIYSCRNKRQEDKVGLFSKWAPKQRPLTGPIPAGNPSRAGTPARPKHPSPIHGAIHDGQTATPDQPDEPKASSRLTDLAAEVIIGKPLKWLARISGGKKKEGD